MGRVVLTFIFIFICSVSNAEIIKVCATCNFTTISSAINNASAGDVIEIHQGVYTEGNLLIDKAISVVGVDWPILDGQNENEILTIISDGVRVEGLILRNVGTSYLEDRSALRLRNSSDFIIKNNRLENAFFGIYLERSNNGIVADNRIIGEAVDEMSSGNGIHLWYCKNIEVSNNIVSSHRDGIYFEFVDNSKVHGNISEHNLRYGLHFMFSNFDEYFQNTFRDNGAGVAVMFSKKIDMYDNLFENNWGKSSYGLLLKEIYDAEITNNKFIKNTIGVYVEGSTRINYSANIFKNNGWAIKVRGGCLDNFISGNDFISNTFDLSVPSNIEGNSFDGNYWSEYKGYDLDKDGIGDVPHRPVKLFNFIVFKTPEAMVLLRSLFVELINITERVSPVFTPKNVTDNSPSMKSFF
ncbi:MAG: nitrous oxide reductase family maturation protein NosD [Chitinophagales bacterium]|nr:nitrous oxide reductase family maturation protein NosD [Chitinophagales bacterium]